MQTMNNVKISGYNIAYSRDGSGEHVLLIHGVLTYSFIWRKMFRIKGI